MSRGRELTDVAHLNQGNISPQFKQEYSVSEPAIRDAPMVVRAAS
jgi:hypothetical protein